MNDLTPKQATIVIVIAILLGLFGDAIYNAI